MDFGSMLPLLLSLMNKDGGGGDNNMASMLSMLSGLNGGGSGGTPDMSQLLSMLKGKGTQKQEKASACPECERRERERGEYDRERNREYEREQPREYDSSHGHSPPDRRGDGRPDNRTDHRPNRGDSRTDTRPDNNYIKYDDERESKPERKILHHSFYETNGIKRFDPIVFDERSKQFGSRPIKNIANDTINKKIDGYFNR